MNSVDCSKRIKYNNCNKCCNNCHRNETMVILTIRYMQICLSIVPLMNTNNSINSNIDTRNNGLSLLFFLLLLLCIFI